MTGGAANVCFPAHAICTNGPFASTSHAFATTSEALPCESCAFTDRTCAPSARFSSFGPFSSHGVTFLPSSSHEKTAHFGSTDASHVVVLSAPLNVGGDTFGQPG